VSFLAGGERGAVYAAEELARLRRKEAKGPVAHLFAEKEGG